MFSPPQKMTVQTTLLSTAALLQHTITPTLVTPLYNLKVRCITYKNTPGSYVGIITNVCHNADQIRSKNTPASYCATYTTTVKSERYTSIAELTPYCPTPTTTAKCTEGSTPTPKTLKELFIYSYGVTATTTTTTSTVTTTVTSITHVTHVPSITCTTGIPIATSISSCTQGDFYIHHKNHMHFYTHTDKQKALDFNITAGAVGAGICLTVITLALIIVLALIWKRYYKINSVCLCVLLQKPIIPLFANHSFVCTPSH